ncbi:Clp protease N-terminal domain-containing protein [Cellulomonas sp. NPDC057328]|uniref:Clp protease N-terminal domain-containing protein n=1 Tax=Cellulomonas sp. NPDC057328 TaxID=3346101 RepID=UPI0036331E79
MSRLTDAVVLSQQIVVTATEEAYRAGHAELDVDHLLVALAAVGGPAGQVLRSLGVTVDRARAAVAQVHADRLARAGVAVPPVPPRDMPRTGGGLPWSPRADRVLSAGRWELPSADDRPDLRALVREPGGFVAEALAVLELDPDRVLAAVDAWRATAPGPSGALVSPDPRPWRTVSRSGWVPAPAAEVWSLVTDPARRTTWDPWYSTVDEQPDGTLLATVVGPADGAKRVPDGFERQHVVPVAREEGRLVEWELRRPDRPGGAPVQRLAVALTPSGDGTRVDLTVRWLGSGGWRAVVGTLLRPVARFTWGQMLLAKHAGIARAVR